MPERTLRTICIASMLSTMALVLLASFNTDMTQLKAVGIGVATFILSSIMNVTWQLANGEKAWKWWQWIPQFIVPAIVAYFVVRILSP